MALSSPFRKIFLLPSLGTLLTLLAHSPCVMITNTTSLEEQVWTIAQTLEELMKSMKEREALRDAQITLLMHKMGNTYVLNHEDESSKPKQTHNDKLESPTKDFKLSTDGSISPD